MQEDKNIVVYSNYRNPLQVWYRLHSFKKTDRSSLFKDQEERPEVFHPATQHQAKEIQLYKLENQRDRRESRWYNLWFKLFGFGPSLSIFKEKLYVGKGCPQVKWWWDDASLIHFSCISHSPTVLLAHSKYSQSILLHSAAGGCTSKNCTNTHTHAIQLHTQKKKNRPADKLLQRALHYKCHWHILQPKFMSCYLIKWRERTWKGGRLNNVPLGSCTQTVQCLCTHLYIFFNCI